MTFAMLVGVWLIIIFYPRYTFCRFVILKYTFARALCHDMPLTVYTMKHFIVIAVCIALCAPWGFTNAGIFPIFTWLDPRGGPVGVVGKCR